MNSLKFSRKLVSQPVYVQVSLKFDKICPYMKIFVHCSKMTYRIVYDTFFSWLVFKLSVNVLGL